MEADFFKSALELDGKVLGVGDADWRGKWKRYQQSKRANLAFGYALGDHIEREGEPIKSLVAHPGATNSGLQSRTDGETYGDRVALGLAVLSGMAPEDGALGITMAVLSETAANKDFFGPDGVTGPPVLLPGEDGEGGKYSVTQKKLLWAESMRATGLEGEGWPAEN